MNRHFKPDSYQTAKKRAQKNRPREPKQVPPYLVRWWRKTKPHEKTDMFYISFSVENDPQIVYDSLTKEFDGNVASICNWVYWYEILLKDEMSWKDIIIRVDKAFKGEKP